MKKPNIIAFYLPQFYPTPENDEWWGPGFTEWTNVAKARKLFPGHYQPRIPGQLGFYDLRLPEIREVQAKMAENAGIDAFCYWHYWSNGERLLDRVFDEVVKSGKPDFPFCLCWANHSWYKKNWHNRKKDILLRKQEYGGVNDYKDHFYKLLPAFKDPRYYKIGDRNVFGIFDPKGFKDIQVFMEVWNQEAKKNDLNDFWFFGYSYNTKIIPEIRNLGISNIVVDFAHEIEDSNPLFIQYGVKILKRFFNIPITSSYKKYTEFILKFLKKNNDIYPSIMPDFDHSPRAGTNSLILKGSTPQKWKLFLRNLFNLMRSRSTYNDVIFIKAWNEWGEGNYLEPDIKFGSQYLDALKEELQK